MAIRIIEKDDRVSWEDLARIQYLAHGPNRAKGVYQKCASLSADKLKQNFKNGRCFVALDDDRPVGLTGYTLCRNFKEYWFCRGETIAELSYCSILPDYQGIGIFGKLNVVCFSAIKEDGVNLMILNTHENNILMRGIMAHYGFKELCWHKYHRCEYISIVMGKWVGKECQISNTHIWIALNWSRLMIRMKIILGRYRLGRVFVKQIHKFIVKK